MVDEIKKQVIVQQGGRIEVFVPHCPPGTRAEVIVLPESPDSHKTSLRSLIGAGPGSFASPEEADAFLRGERDSWD